MSRTYAHSLSGLEEALPPENEYLYRTKPLPPPPMSSRPASRSTQSLHSVPVRLHDGRRSHDHIPLRPSPLVLHPAKTRSEMMPPSPGSRSPGNARRRSSHKLHQLTGHDVGSHDYVPVRRILSASASPTDSSSSYSQSFDRPILEEENMCETARYSESSAPPALEPDCDGTSSKRSSDAPKSPRNVMFHSPPMKQPPSTIHYSSAPGSLDHVPGLHVTFPEDGQWRASKSYTYFSDSETADEYHRITTDLATLPIRDSLYTTSPTPTQTSFSSRLSLSARSLFSRRRDTPSSLELTRPHTAPQSRPLRTPHPRQSSVGSDSTAASQPQSVFESDDEDEDDDHNVRGTIRDFFVRRDDTRASTGAMMPPPRPSPPRPERPSRSDVPSLFSKTGGQVKGLLASARGPKMSKAERRRNELRSRIRVIPEATVVEGNFF